MSGSPVWPVLGATVLKELPAALLVEGGGGGGIPRSHRGSS